MESIRGKVIGFAKMQGKEDVFIARALGTLIALLEKIPKGEEYEFQCDISYLLSEFSTVFMAALAVIRSGRPLEEIEQMEKSLKKVEKGAQTQFLTWLLAPLCLQANMVAIEITVFFLYVRNDRISSCAKEVLEKSGQNGGSRSATVAVLQKWIPRKRSALALLAKIDTPSTMTRAVSLFTNRDENIRYEALSILANGPLSKEIADSISKILKSGKAGVIWSSMEHCEVCCDLVKHAFESGFLSKEDAIEILQTAFQHEDCNRGLAHLLPAIKAVCPENRQILLDGFLGMEKRNSRAFTFRKETVKEFLAGLAKAEALNYLEKALAVSEDRDFLWLGGQYLIATDIVAASRLFVEIAKAKSATKKIGTLAQLAMKVCLDEKNSGKWEAENLDKGSKSRFTPVAQALFDYAEEDACPLETCLAITHQPGMFGGTVAFCRRAIPLLGKVILDEKASPEQVREALQALLNTGSKRGLAQEVAGMLKKIYASPRKKVLLNQMLFILVNDVRGYPVEPLYPAIVAFLANKAKESDAVPILKKALNAEKPNADLGMSARATYVTALKKFALAGSARAVAAIADYRGDNIWGDVIPKTLVDIYQKTSLKEVSEQAAIGAADRFLFSINEPSTGRLFYLNELIAMEGLKESPTVQKAFLKGVAAIADIGNSRSPGMCGIVKKISTILPVKKSADAHETLNRLLNNLDSERENHIAECEQKRMRPHKEYLKTIVTISAEAGLALATM